MANTLRRESPQKLDTPPRRRPNMITKHKFRHDSYSGHTGTRKPSLHKTELIRLNEDMNSFELSLSIGKPVSLLDNFFTYKTYLEDLALSLKLRDHHTGSSFIKGLIGLTKAVESLLSDSEKTGESLSMKQVTVKKDMSIQTDKEAFVEDPVSDFNLDKIKQFQGKIRGIQYGRISRHLVEVLDSLKNMYTEVPEASELPDIQSLDFSSLKTHSPQIVELANNDPQLKVNKAVFQVHRANQTDQESDGSNDPKEFLMEMLKEKELALFTTKSQLEMVTKEKRKSDELYTKYKSDAVAYQMRYDALVKELNSSGSPSNSHEQTVIIQALKQQLEQKKERVFFIKQDLAVNKMKNYRKIPLLQEVEDKLFDHKVDALINQEKLAQIEKLWREEKEKSFEYMNIDRESVIQKHTLVKRDFIQEFKDEEPNEKDIKYINLANSTQNDVGVSKISETPDLQRSEFE